MGGKLYFCLIRGLRGSPICSTKNGRRIFDSGMDKKIKVSDLCINGAFSWPLPNSFYLTELSEREKPIIAEIDDVTAWVTEGSGVFTVKSAWSVIN
jgi:hypothetical protein